MLSAPGGCIAFLLLKTGLLSARSGGSAEEFNETSSKIGVSFLDVVARRSRAAGFSRECRHGRTKRPTFAVDPAGGRPDAPLDPREYRVAAFSQLAGCLMQGAGIISLGECSRMTIQYT